MQDKKDKKKTLTISKSFTKKIDMSNINKGGKKSFAIEKKSSFKNTKSFNKNNLNTSFHKRADPKKTLNRKFIEQQATKEFIKKSEDKIASKKKLRLKGPIDKKDFKLTVSRALNVEEIEIKQRSLASVKRARLKEKRNAPENEEKIRLYLQ